jgi:hypothetical protein
VLDQQLRALQDGAFAYWVQATAYPVVISLHSVGLALLVGLLVVIDLRVLGFARGLPLPALRKLMTVVWIGFAVNAVSGAMLFSIDASKDFYSTLFRVKLSAIAIGLIIGAVIKAKVLTPARPGAAPDAGVAPWAKVLAALSLATWAGAIVAGRLMAYFTFSDIGVAN